MIFNLIRELGHKTGVYLIRNNVNYRRYVGSAASSFIGRLQNHVQELKKGNHWNPRLQNSWRKHGDSACEFIVLEECPPEQCEQREQWWIDHLCPEYNVCPVAGSRLGYHHTEATKDRMRASHLGKVFSDEHRRHISEAKRGCKNPHRGYVWTGAQRLAASISRKGRKAWNLGIPHTAESRRKMSLSQLARYSRNRLTLNYLQDA